jgi:hypothetical protein
VNDELREQLGRLDPMHSGVPVESSTTPSSHTRLEQIMNSPLIEQEPSNARSTHPGGPSPHINSDRDTRRRRTLMIIGGAAAAAAIALGSVAIIRGGDDVGELADGPPLELSLGAGDTLASCIPFDVALLASMTPAFAATATSIDDGTVTLAVDRWYTGGDAATVTLQAPSGMQALIDGFDFEVGQQYLITAAEGNVNFCGFSGVATPELSSAFETAFGG